VPVTVGQTTPGIDAQILFAPSGITNPASGVTLDSGTLNGTVNPNGTSTQYYFQWGPTTSYGNVTPTQSAGSGTSTIAVLAKITGLTPHTTYHYRLVVTFTYGTYTWTRYGADKTFETTVKGMPWMMLLLGE
jgi:hypothetical protein